MKRYTMNLEGLERRSLLSASAPTAAKHVSDALASDAVTQVAAATTKTLHPLGDAFNVAGTFSRATGRIGNPDAGPQYLFNGTGKNSQLGSFTVTGDLKVPGFVANGKAFGTLKLSNSHGSIEVSVSGPPQSPGVLPSSLTFTIVKGHGAYLHSKGTGKIVLSASETTHKFLFKFNQSK